MVINRTVCVCNQHFYLKLNKYKKEVDIIFFFKIIFLSSSPAVDQFQDQYFLAL